MSTDHRKPTESELEILETLWKHGPCTVRQVNDQLLRKRKVGYTTTLKMMQIMHDKGLLERELQGRSHQYRAAITREQTQKQMVNKLVNGVFGGSASKLVMRALGNHQPSKEEIAEIKALLNQMDNNAS